MDDRGRGPFRDIFPPALSRKDIFFLAFVTAFIFLQVFVLPFTPIYFEGDQLLPVTNAMRILDGEVMYRDFFHFAPPGTELYYSALFSLLGAKVWVVNATIVLLGLAQLALVFAFSRKTLAGAYCYLPAFIYFVIGFRLFGIDGSYRLFSVVFVLSAVLVVAYRRETKALIVAGILCGIASFFVQTRGLLGIGAIGLFLLWLHWNQGVNAAKLFRDWLIAGSAFLITVVLTQFYFAWNAGFDNYFFANVIFLKDYYGSDTLSNTAAYFTDIPSLNSYINTYGTAGGIFRFIRVSAPTLFFYALVPLVYLVCFIYRKLRKVPPETDRDLVLLSILGSVLFFGASAPTAFRLYHISIPAVVIAVWLLSRLAKREGVARALVAALLVLGGAYSWQRQTATNAQVKLPAGRVAFLAPATAEKYKWLAAHLAPGEYVYEAQHPTFYFPLHLKNPTPFYLVRDNNYTPSFQVEQLMESLRSNPPRFIIWQGSWSKPEEERKTGDNLAPLWEFILSNYQLKKEFRETGEFTVNSERDIEFWERKE